MRAGLITVLIIAILTAIFAWDKREAEAPEEIDRIETPDTTSTSSPITKPGDNPPVVLPGGPAIIVVGMSECLPHRNTSGPQTLECAFGIQRDSDGKHFGLDFTNSGNWPPNFPTGERFRIEGITRPATDSKYNIDSVIQVLKIEQL